MDLDMDRLSSVAERLGLKVQANREAPPQFSQLSSSFSLTINHQSVHFTKEPGSPTEWVSDKLKIGRLKPTRFCFVLIPAVKLSELDPELGNEPSQKPADSLTHGVTAIRVIDEHDKIVGEYDFLAHGPYYKKGDIDSYLMAASKSFDRSYSDLYERRH